MTMSFTRRNLEKLGYTRPPPDAVSEESTLAFLHDEQPSPLLSDGTLTDPGDEQPRTQSVLSLLSWGDDEFERESTREVERQWIDLESLLYEGETDGELPETLREECQLWRQKFPHLRVLGRHLPIFPSRPRSGAVVPVMILTESGPVDEDKATHLRFSGIEETYAIDGAPQTQPDSEAAADAAAGRSVENPETLIQDMVINSLVSILWADYVEKMTPVFQLSMESADNMKLTSISREVSARARHHSDPGSSSTAHNNNNNRAKQHNNNTGLARAGPLSKSGDQLNTEGRRRRERRDGGERKGKRAPLRFDRQFGDVVAEPPNDAATSAPAPNGSPAKARANSRERPPLPPVRPPPGGRAGQQLGRARAARSTLPRISASTETARSVTTSTDSRHQAAGTSSSRHQAAGSGSEWRRQAAPAWSRHRGRVDTKTKLNNSNSNHTGRREESSVSPARGKESRPAADSATKSWGRVSRSSCRLLSRPHR